MHHLKLYLTLIRFDKPIGRILLAWPCLWGIAYAYHTTGASLPACLTYGVLLTAGAFLMSGFGCIINDLADKDFDSQVERTKTRPLAAGTLTLKQAIICAGILAALSCVVFWIIAPIARLYASLGAVLLFIYPFMKRVTYYPQAVLGLAFNTGVLVGYASLSGQPTASAWYLYACGVFWTIAYDTIYAFQDITDDQKIGVKSTAIRFRNHPKLMVGACYMLGFIFLCLSKGRLSLSFILYTFFSVYTLVKWNPIDTKSAGKHFRLHVYGSVFGLV
jgi:4-hydroxybenzoate polyprenyltransferase